MTTFPSIPGWDGIHPAIVQFPIALLFVAPLLLLVSLFSRQAWRTWAGSALLLMGLGSVAAWFAVASGHAAAQLIDKTPTVAQAIAQHEAFGLQLRMVFTILTVTLAVLVLLPAVIRKPLPGAVRISLHAVFLVAYLACTMVIANTAVRGGRLVHDLGLRAMVDRPSPQAVQPADQETPRR